MTSALLLALVLCTPPAAAVSGPVVPAESVWQQLPATLGARRWVHPTLVAEVLRPGARPTQAVAVALRTVDATAEVTLEQGRVRLWRVADARAVRRALPAAVAAQVAPVLLHTPSTAARLEVPVGGVVMQVAEGVDVCALAAAQGWTLDGQLADDLFLLAAAPGDASLALAVSAEAVPGVLLAVPDAWRPAYRR